MQSPAPMRGLGVTALLLVACSRQTLPVEPNLVDEDDLASRSDLASAVDLSSAPAIADLAVTADLTSAPAIVRGTVVDRSGKPIGILAVSSGSAVAVTDVNGGFTIAVASLPYDLRVVGTQSGEPFGYLFRGLTRLDPRLTLVLHEFYPPPTEAKTASFSVELSGPSPSPSPSPLPAKQSINVCFSHALSFCSERQPFDFSRLDLPTAWYGPATVMSDVLVLLWDRTAAPEVAIGHARTSAPVTSGELTSIDLALTPPPVGEVTGTLAPPPPSTTYLGFVTLRFGQARKLLTRVASIDSGGNYRASLPMLSDVTYDIEILTLAGSRQSTAWWIGVTPPANLGSGVTLPPAPVLLEPATNAIGVDTATPIRFTPPPGFVSVVYLTPDSRKEWIVVTAEAETRFPDFSDLGMPLPSSGAQIRWEVLGYPYASVDEATGASGIVVAPSRGGPHFQTRSGSRTFQFR